MEAAPPHDAPANGLVAATPLFGRTTPAVRGALFAGWLVVVAIFAWHHVFWRDEVRALTLALSGDGFVGMARAVHGEGHPLLWYILLRAAHAVVPVREVLPAVGLAVGIAGAALFAWRAPFRPLALATVLFGGWMTFEYAVMARNYGIAMLLMFLVADRFARRRDSGWMIGGLLFLLANTNVPAVILAGGFLLFWLVEILARDGLRWTPALRPWLGATVLMLLGAVVAFMTVYPPFNEAAVASHDALTPAGVLAAGVSIGASFSYLWPEPLWWVPGAGAILALLMLAGPLSLLRSPGAAIAAFVTLPMTALFFQLVYLGSYRHQALYLCFLVALHWMVAAGRGGTWRRDPALARGTLPRLGGWLFTALLALQTVTTASLLVQVAEGRVEGQSAVLARLLHRPDLSRAIVVAVPEVAVEPLRYYAPNPTFLIRQRRFAAVTRFTRQSDWHLTLGGILATMRTLQARTGRPVVALVQYPLTPATGEQWWDEGILGDVHVRPGDAAAFLAATRRIAEPVPLIHHGAFDENYWVYVLRDPPDPRPAPSPARSDVTAF